MLDRLVRYLKQLRSLQRVNLAMSRAAATAPLRAIDPTTPRSWEFSAFSQNGEDGIIDELTRRLLRPNRFFIEIGASDGLENNTTWLALGRRWAGVWIEGDAEASEACRALLGPLNYGVDARTTFVTRERVRDLVATLPHRDPDVCSLDVDGNDHHLVAAMLAAGLRPKIWAVEYNSAYGPERSVSIPYRQDFRVVPRRGENLYYGCSITAWRRLLERAGYRFVTVESNGVNAFFADAAAFDASFLQALRGTDYLPNTSHTREYGADPQAQLDLLRGRELLEIE